MFVFEPNLALTMFSMLAWGATLLTSCVIVYVLRSDHSLLLRPSCVAIITFNLQSQWSVAFATRKALAWFHDPWPFFCVIFVVPLIAMFGLAVLYRVTALRFRAVLVAESPPVSFVFLPCLLGVFIFYWYFRSVPLTETGLYAAIFRPDLSYELRERSLKLLPSHALQYVLTLWSSVVVPFALSVFCADLFRTKRLPVQRVLMAILAIILVLSASISGA
ncbi:hypothetical protein EBZ37_03880, partial [bacterium]|nr:hypothetical protein [bacterium]